MTRAAMSVEAILDRIRQLSPTEQSRLWDALTALMTQQPDGQPKRSILELQGLGKELWEGIDAQEYVRRERAGWAG